MHTARVSVCECESKRAGGCPVSVHSSQLVYVRAKVCHHFAQLENLLFTAKATTTTEAAAVLPFFLAVLQFARCLCFSCTPNTLHMFKHTHTYTHTRAELFVCTTVCVCVQTRNWNWVIGANARAFYFCCFLQPAAAACVPLARPAWCCHLAFAVVVIVVFVMHLSLAKAAAAAFRVAWQRHR